MTDELKLKDIKFDKRNYRIHSQTNKDLIKKSVEECGLARSIVIDSQNEIIGGNGLVSSIPKDTKIKVIETKGDELVVVKRTDLKTNDEKRRKLAILDNSTTDTSEFNTDMLLEDYAPEELQELGIEVETTDVPMEEIEEDDIPEEIQTRSQKGDLWKLGEHYLLCGDSTDKADIDRLMQGNVADMVMTDPPYNVNIKNSQNMTIANDNMSNGAFSEFLDKLFEVMASVLKEGGAFYVWHGDNARIEFETNLKKHGLPTRETLIWAKNHFNLGRQDYQHQTEPCQPTGTMIRTPKGEIAIENIKDGYCVIAYNPLYSGGIVEWKKGVPVKTANRQYTGTMYTICVDNKQTRTTDNHQFTVRFNAKTKKNYCTYLMKRGNWWRVGIARAYDARQFGLKTRFNQEKAEAVWILGLYKDKIEAQVHEQILSVKYGIPYTIWEFDRFCGQNQRQAEQIKEIYDNLDLKNMEQNAHRLLHDFHRSEKYPFITKANKSEKFSTRATAKINACNLVPELMEVPIPHDKYVWGKSSIDWKPIEKIEHKEVINETVYSLEVPKHQHYIADGIVTHNCLYGWKEGASHYFIEEYNHSTLIDELGKTDIDKLSKEKAIELLKKIYKLPTTLIKADKPIKNDLHPTMKNVRMLASIIRNSSKPNEIVLDVCGGSGSTLIACEQLGRRCFINELDPKYCDVIIQRWEDFTKQKAELIKTNADN